MLHEIINLLGKVEYNGNGHYQNKTKEKGTQKLPDNIPVNYFNRQ
jgi:hypothetical protein